MPNKSAKYRGRFAPSPSGRLHFGSLVAAVGSYLDARHCQGEWLLRIEDIDPPREKPGATESIIATLEAFGFEWDDEILYQSNAYRAKAYQQALEQLSEQGITYLCACTRKQINETGVMGIEGRIYPGTCRKSPPSGRSARTTRICTDDCGIGFQDLVCGSVQQNIFSESGDFIVRRADGLIAYQLAVVVDDAFQRISRVVRGADLLLSTPRQIYLQQRLNLPTPTYAHLPLVRDTAGRKLSKQSLAQPVNDENPLPALLAAWHYLGQALPEHQPGSPGEFWPWAISNWDISRVPADSNV
ncbi:MAG: tRNA glutamyl-Q(34) synthetase GluQRS [Gammaproteobacteria bacterium]|nr:tRNA glutamyl-Q(34) synthetase GluQRS [Gammaproteobacteria bacterium]